MYTKKNKVVSSHKQSKVCTNIVMFSTNGAGVVTGKAESLRNEISATNTNIVTV